MGRGIFGGILQGYQQGQKLAMEQQSQDRQSENDKVDRELRQEQLIEVRRKQKVEADRRTAINDSMKPAGMDEQGQPRKEPPIYQKLENAGNNLLKNFGDLDGYNDMMGKSAAAKTLHYTTKVQNAYRSGDVNAAVEMLNEFPNGVKYTVQAEPGGKLLGRAVAADGREVGQTAFNSTDEFFAFLQDKMNPVDISAKIRADAEGRTKAMITRSKMEESAAEVESKRAQAGKYRAEADSDIAMRPGRVGGLAADIRKSNAQAASSYASAGNSGTTSDIRNFGFFNKLSPEQQASYSKLNGKVDSVDQNRSKAILAQANQLASISNADVKNFAKQKAPEDFLEQAAMNVDNAEKAAGARRAVGGPQPASTANASSFPIVKNQAEYNKIPIGAAYKDPSGKTRVKMDPSE